MVDMDVGVSPPDGLMQIISALSRQLDDARRQLSHLENLKSRKENLINTAKHVLQEHCTASFDQNQLSNLHAAILSTDFSSSGWRVKIQALGLPNDLLDSDIIIYAAHSTIPCTISQLDSAQIDGKYGGTAVAEIQLQGSPTVATGNYVEVYALILSSNNKGNVMAAVPAGRLPLDFSAWIAAQSRPPTENGENLKKLKEFSAHYSLESKFYTTIEALEVELDSILCTELGFGPKPQNQNEDDWSTAKKWTLGSSAEVQSIIDGHSLRISVYSSSLQLLWGLDTAIKANLSDRNSSSTENSFIWRRIPNTRKVQNDTYQKTLLQAVDALIAEIDGVFAWIVAVKEVDEGEGAGAADGREQVMAAQDEAIEAMMRTDDAAATALSALSWK